MPQMKLHEVAGKRGEAEKIRIMLKEAGISFSMVEPDESEFRQMCTYDDGSLLMGELPSLQIDSQDAHLEQSAVIIEYIAAAADAASGDGVVKYCGEDSNRAAVRAIASKATEAHRAVFNANEGERKDIIHKYFEIFQNIIKKNDDDDASTEEFMIGKQFTYADISVFEFVNACTENFSNVGLRTFPKLKEFHDVIAAKPRISMHLSMRAPLDKKAESTKW